MREIDKSFVGRTPKLYLGHPYFIVRFTHISGQRTRSVGLDTKIEKKAIDFFYLHPVNVH